MKIASLVAPLAFAFAIAAASPASAADIVSDCNADLDAFTPAALSCAGYYEGNILNNSSNADLDIALDVFGIDSTGFNSYIKIDNFGDDPLLEFGQALVGVNIVGIHFGDAGTGSGNRTGFFLFDFGTTPTSSITTTLSGVSGGLIVPGAVPEPGTWAMMLLGFGAVGFAMRRSRRKTAPLAQAV